MDQLYKKILNFQHRVNDWIDNPSQAGNLRQAVQRLEDDAQSRKDPVTIEGQVKSVIRALQDSSRNGVMSAGHADELIDQCEDFIQELRRLR